MRALVVLALASTVACRTATRDADPAGRAEAAPLQVDNHYRADVVVSLLRGSVRARLGMVVTGARGTFRIPASYVGDPGGFYLLADPVGATPLRSERVVVRAGERVTWTLESDLTRSSLAVY